MSGRRRATTRLLALAAACGAAAGCGASGERASSPAATIDMARYGPQESVARDRVPAAPIRMQAPSADVAGELRAGTVGVMDTTGTVSVRPAALETSGDARLERLTWSEWTASGAQATGELRLLDCQPNCAIGSSRRIRATVELRDVRVCAGRSYFATAAVTVAEGDRPTSYLRAPC